MLPILVTLTAEVLLHEIKSSKAMSRRDACFDMVEFFPERQSKLEKGLAFPNCLKSVLKK